MSRNVIQAQDYKWINRVQVETLKMNKISPFKHTKLFLRILFLSMEKTIDLWKIRLCALSYALLYYSCVRLFMLTSFVDRSISKWSFLLSDGICLCINWREHFNIVVNGAGLWCKDKRKMQVQTYSGHRPLVCDNIICQNPSKCFKIPVIIPKDMITVVRFVAKEQIKRPRAATIPPINIVSLCPCLWIIKLATGP